MIQNIWPGETSAMVSEHAKFLGTGFRAAPNLPSPSPFFPWHILQAIGFAVFWKIFSPALASAFAGMLNFAVPAGADLVFLDCGQIPLAYEEAVTINTKTNVDAITNVFPIMFPLVLALYGSGA